MNHINELTGIEVKKADTLIKPLSNEQEQRKVQKEPEKV